MRRAVLSIAIAVLCPGAVPFTQNPIQPVPRFRSSVDLVVLDVSVLDRNRMPVRDLTEADFTILEDGVLQEIASFTAIDLPDTERTEVSAPWVREVAPDVQTNDERLADRPIFVIVLDDSTPMPAADVPATRELGRRVIERLPPDAIAAVVFTLDHTQGNEFTDDRSRLLAAINRFNGSSDMLPSRGGTAVPFDQFMMEAGTLYRSTVGTLRDVAENLADLPQRRKAVIFISVGLPLDIGLNAPALAGDLEANNLGAGEVMQHIMRDLYNTVRAAQLANVNVYSLDPGGLRAPFTVRSPLTGGSRLEGNPGRFNREFLQTVSDSTGGFAITNTNDLGPGITQIVRENASYYLLGYRPSNHRAEGRRRRIEVKVNRRDVTVRTRNGYYEPGGKGTETNRAQSRPATSLDKVIASPVYLAGMSLRAAAAPFALPGDRNAGVAIVLGVHQQAPPGFAQVEDNLEVLVRAYDVNGKNVASDRLVGKTTLRPNSGGQVAYEFLTRLDLKPGRYHLRLAAVSSLLAKSGSVFCDVDVPDFSRQPVSLSGVAIARMPGLPSGPWEKIASLVPIVPTAERQFARDDPVTAFLRAYQGGDGQLARVPFAIDVRDSRNGVVFVKREQIEADRFAENRSADIRFDLPVATLEPGEHLLTVEATLGKRTVRRQVRFAVR